MRVHDIMTPHVQTALVGETLKDAARKMVAADIGFLPVSDGDRLVGTITDRDIVSRAVAEGRSDMTLIEEIMTRDVKYCFDDDEVDELLKTLGDAQVRRMPVVDRQKRLIGVVSLGDAARKADPANAGFGLSAIVEPNSAHVH